MTNAVALTLPGVSGNLVTAPDSVALSITGDLTLMCRLALPAWKPPGGSMRAVGKWASTGATRSYMLLVAQSTGVLRLVLSSDGSAATVTDSSVAPTITDGVPLWVLSSWRASDGRVQFFTADGTIADPQASDFTQLGTDKTAAIASIKDNATAASIGSDADNGGPTAGKFYRAKILNGVFSTTAFGGSVVADFDASQVTVLGVRNPTTYSDGSNTWTVGGSLWNWLTLNRPVARSRRLARV